MLRKSLNKKPPMLVINSPQSGFGDLHCKWIFSKLNETINDNFLNNNFINNFGLDKNVLENLLM